MTQDLTEKYRSLGVEKGGELLLRLEHALRFMEDCRTARVVILRMDYWHESQAGIGQSSLWADLSEFADRKDGPEKSATCALEILGKRMPNGECWVSFVVDDPLAASESAEPV